MKQRVKKSPLTHIEVVEVSKLLPLMADEEKHIDLWMHEIAAKLSEALNRDLPLSATQARKACNDFGFTFKARKENGGAPPPKPVEDHNVAELVKRLASIERKLDLIARQVEVPDWAMPENRHA